MIFKNKKNDREAAPPEESQEELFDETSQSCESVLEGDPATEKISELEAALKEEKDRAIRCYAELENVRRRSAKELADERKYSGMDVIRSLLPVLDNLQRAIEAAEKQNADDPLLEGVRMVLQQFVCALEHNDCKKIEALHQPFDPNFHQAISQTPSCDFPENTVIMVTQDGYTLADRVVRPSQVIVSRCPESE
ncbi:MAG: nucleotide exchange factor GrpE [Planctomycetia bacterium]|nr:nucleotide exchange factor GrpE [Planctomycetia bacterium]